MKTINLYLNVIDGREVAVQDLKILVEMKDLLSPTNAFLVRRREHIMMGNIL